VKAGRLDDVSSAHSAATTNIGSFYKCRVSLQKTIRAVNWPCSVSATRGRFLGRAAARPVDQAA
jgi:hypothetical protein